MPSALLCVVGRLWECKFRERLKWAGQGFGFHRDRASSIAVRDRAGEMERALPVSSSLLDLALHVSLGNNSCSHRCDSKVPSSALPWHAGKPEKVRVLSPGSGAVGLEKEGQEDTLQAFLPLWFPYHTICAGEHPGRSCWAPLVGAGAAHICSLPSLLTILSYSWRERGLNLVS